MEKPYEGKISLDDKILTYFPEYEKVAEAYLQELTIKDMLKMSTASDGYGYGYQFWRTQNNGFSFNGMGNQFAICIPDKDFVFVCTADNQYNASAAEIIYENVFEKIVSNLAEHALKESEHEYRTLQDYCKGLRLVYAKGSFFSEYEKEVNGVSYVLNENPMKIKTFTLSFEKDGKAERQGKFLYVDDEGEHELPFGLGKNIFTEFPEENMPGEIGSEVEEGYRHKCAVSGAWVEEKKLFIKVQIVDKYLANLNITIGFRENKVGVRMIVHAEYFLEKYNGYASGMVD